jgi:protein-tyrosine phosphatase
MSNGEQVNAVKPVTGRSMSQKWWRLGLSVAVIMVLSGHLTVAWLLRESPNYSQIEPVLYLGGFVAEPPRGVKAVLNLCENQDPYQVEVHRWEPIRDAKPAPSFDWLREQVAFITAQREAGRTVFVHCRNGISRSGMVMVAYVMAQRGWSVEEALAFVRSRRMVRPNSTFLPHLQEWEKSLR